MNSKELFEKIKSSIAEALNKGDGIMLGGKKITFHQHDESVEGKLIRNSFTCVEVHVYNRKCSKSMWFVTVYNVFYENLAAQLAVVALEETFSEENPIILPNGSAVIENGFQIAITFDENQIKDS